jgi:hypothetical protein
MTILERISGKQDGKMWTGCIWLRIGSNGGIKLRIPLEDRNFKKDSDL